MGEKSASNLIAAIEKSKSAGLDKLIYALGIRNVGEKAARSLAEEFREIDSLINADVESITKINDLGAVTADCIVNFFSHSQNRELVQKLKECGILTSFTVKTQSKIFEGVTFVLTGTLPTMSRSEAEALIIANGGKASGSVSKKTSYVLAGAEAGSKLAKAETLGVKIIDEQQFIEMLNNGTKEI